jgi:hypothetical protein
MPMLRQATLSTRPIWLVCHRDPKDIHRVRVVLDFLAPLFQ